MKSSPMIDFHVEEYEKRLQYLCSAMQKEKISGAIIANAENIRYYSSFQSVTWDSKISTPAMVIISSSGKMAIISSASAYECVQYTSCVEDEYIYRHNNYNNRNASPNGQVETIAEVMQCLGITGTVGLEAGDGMYLHFPMHLIDGVIDYCKNIQFVDISRLIKEQRSIKSFNEQVAVQKANYIFENSLKYAFSVLEIGKTSEKEFAALFCQRAYALHAEQAFPPAVCFGKDRYGEENSYGCSDQRLTGTDGEYFSVCGGAVKFKGMFAGRDCAGLIGTPSDQQQQAVSWCNQARDYLLGQVKPGANIKAIIESTNSFLEKATLIGKVAVSCHGIGLDYKEWPADFLEEETVLQTGMTLCFCVQISEANIGKLCIDQPVLVTKYGYQLLTEDLISIASLRP